MTSKDLKGPQMTPNGYVKPDTKTKATIKRTSIERNRNILKAGSMQENFEINHEYLDETLHYKNL